MHVVVWYLFIWATIQRKDHETLTFVQLEALEVFFSSIRVYMCH